MAPVRTRFAPSPTGPLHLGHAYSAILAHDFARARGGDFLLRIEDIDRGRSRPEWEDAIFRDLDWLGLDWERPVWRQSGRLPIYRDALSRLGSRGLLYPCWCRRKDILEAASAPNEGAPVAGPDGIVYPGTCRPTENAATPTVPAQAEAALRLDMARALAEVDEVAFTEEGRGPDGQSGRVEVSRRDLVERVGDVVLSRRDMGTSYHLAVVVDDAAQEISHVVRGADLFAATAIHVLLQRLLGLPTPVYVHHRLIRDDAGRRLAKRDDARAISAFRDAGETPADIRRRVVLE